MADAHFSGLKRDCDDHRAGAVDSGRRRTSSAQPGGPPGTKPGWSSPARTARALRPP